MAASNLTPGFDQTNAKMLEEQLLCDIIFEVGGERIGAHKFILASRNSTFRYKFLEAPYDIYIILADKDPNIVWTFFRYLYTGVVEVTATNADALFCIAVEYQVEDLIEKCVDVLASALTPESACMQMKRIYNFATGQVIENCVEFIVVNTRALYTDQLESLPQPCLQAVLASEGLCLPEEEVYKIAMKWAEAQCGLQNLEVTGENLRKVLGDAFFEIRFPVMNGEYYVDNVSKNGLLTSVEEKGILLHILQKKKGTLTLPFKAYRRGSLLKHEMIRFRMEKTGWVCRGQKKDAICFVPTAAITLYGIEIYGRCDQDGQLNVMVILQETGGNILTSTTVPLQTNINKSLYHILFNQPVVLHCAGVEYHIICSLEGGKTYFGHDGQETVNENGVEIKFKRSQFSTNNTDVNQGQIPGLIYSLNI